MNSASTATKISGKGSNYYWIYQGPYGRGKNLASNIFLKGVVGPYDLIDGLTQNYNATNSGFSLNGVHCLTGSVGTTMAMSQSVTPFRGVHARGHGGNRGRYPDRYNDRIQTFRPLAISPAYFASYVRPSVLSNKGMLARRYRWINTGQYPNYWVQPDYTGNQTDSASQGLYTHRKAAANYCHYDVNTPEKYVDYFKNCGATDCQTTPARGYTMNIQQANAPYTKTLHQPKDASDYTLRVQRKCSNPVGFQRPFPYAVQTGTGVLTGGISVNNVANACNTSKTENVPPDWYTGAAILDAEGKKPTLESQLEERERKERREKEIPLLQAKVYNDLFLNGTSRS